jgi:hypothetical protein
VKSVLRLCLRGPKGKEGGRTTGWWLRSTDYMELLDEADMKPYITLYGHTLLICFCQYHVRSNFRRTKGTGGHRNGNLRDGEKTFINRQRESFGGYMSLMWG